MAGLGPGGRGMFAVSLSPGRYALMCLFPNPSAPDVHFALPPKRHYLGLLSRFILILLEKFSALFPMLTSIYLPKVSTRPVQSIACNKGTNESHLPLPSSQQSNNG